MCNNHQNLSVHVHNSVLSWVSDRKWDFSQLLQCLDLTALEAVQLASLHFLEFDVTVCIENNIKHLKKFIYLYYILYLYCLRGTIALWILKSLLTVLSSYEYFGYISILTISSQKLDPKFILSLVFFFKVYYLRKINVFV